MLLVHQAGSVKIGEVVRYTLTYTPADDRILPAPSSLYVKIKNSSPIPLRAAWVHGPYNLDVSVRPSNFRINEKVQNPDRDGVPQFEPQLKAGSSWNAEIPVPEDIREDARLRMGQHGTATGKSITWIIDIASQVIFSSSASVHFELLVARDEKALELGLTGSTSGKPGRVEDHQHGKGRKEGRHTAQPTGVYSRAVKLVVDDTASLWDPPDVPEWTDRGVDRGKGRDRKENDPQKSADASSGEVEATNGEGRKQKKVHLVILTHGLHSNTSADMLFLKESINAAAKQARQDAKERRARYKNPDSRNDKDGSDPGKPSINPAPQLVGDEDEDFEEEMVVRGFTGNVVRTERGIKYLGKRLAKYVLELTYPDQPFLPIKKSTARNITRTLTGQSTTNTDEGKPSHSSSTIHRSDSHKKNLPYRITKISFIGHSLGGLTQTYAIAYIKKHSPHFFDGIKPINFVALASPFLGLSNENPIYVKFALDFGLVGRTGQDLGLTWRAPAVVRTGWSAIVSGIGAGAHNMHDEDPRAKPLLRILPTGPAHQVLKMFRNRTVYSNVVNDGIVPLRTSCLLFLDWRSLGKVEKARRENGLVGTMAGWGWAELTGAVTSSHRARSPWGDRERRVNHVDDDNDSPAPGVEGNGGTEVPEPPSDATTEDNTQNSTRTARVNSHRQSNGGGSVESEQPRTSTDESVRSQSPMGNFLSFLRPKALENGVPNIFQQTARKSSKLIQRGQVIAGGVTDDAESGRDSGESLKVDTTNRKENRGPTAESNLLSPPTTTFFESATDLLRPPLPPLEFIIDPSSRPKTIFHDRVYHPEDIPPPPVKHNRTTFGRSFSESSTQIKDGDHVPSEAHRTNSAPIGTMKVEEKIAGAYHRDLSWRKVLVRLEPDAHNNIVVRRMFSNAYGWPVVQHLVDTHFADTAAARTADEHETRGERAGHGVDDAGRETDTQRAQGHYRSRSEAREAEDTVQPLPSPGATASSASASSLRPQGPRAYSSEESVAWSDHDFEVTDDEDEDEDNPRAHRPLGGLFGSPPSRLKHEQEHGGTSQAEISDFLNGSPPQTRTELVTEEPRPNSGLGLPAALKEHTAEREPAEDVEPGMIPDDKKAIPAVQPVSPGQGSEDLTQVGLRKSLDATVASPPLSKVATGEAARKTVEGGKSRDQGS